MGKQASAVDTFLPKGRSCGDNSGQTTGIIVWMEVRSADFKLKIFLDEGGFVFRERGKDRQAGKHQKKGMAEFT